MIRDSSLLPPDQTYFYITPTDIATELGIPVEELKREDSRRYLEGLGLRCDREVFDLVLTQDEPYGFFVGERTLKRERIEAKWPAHERQYDGRVSDRPGLGSSPER
jgi:hypothetical protein